MVPYKASSEIIFLLLHGSALTDPFGRNRMTGKVKWFSDFGGYGLIGRSDGPDVFVHSTSIIGEQFRSLNEGDVVEFELVQGAHGPQATGVIVRPKTQRGHS